MTKNSNKPAIVLRDGSLAATIWRNESEQGNSYFTTVFSRTFTEGEEVRSSNTFSTNELLRVAHLAFRAYDAVRELGAEQRNDSKAAAPEPAAG